MDLVARVVPTTTSTSSLSAHPPHMTGAYHPLPGEAHTRMVLPGCRIGIVIGRGGEVIRSICDATGAHVTIASPGVDERDAAHRLASVTGSVMAVCWAVDLLAHKAGLYDGHSNIHPDFQR